MPGRRARTLAVAAGIVASLPGCGSLSSQAAHPAVPSAAAVAVPAPPLPPPPLEPALVEQAYPGARTYAGLLECAGCTASQLTITVFADGTYRLREAPIAEGADDAKPVRPILEERGRWHGAHAASDRIVLEAAEGTRVLQRVIPDGLTILDHEGRAIRGLRDPTLARAPSVDPLSGPMRLSGDYERDERRHVLVDCATGRALPLLPDAGAGSPQVQAWLASPAVRERARAALASLDGARDALQPGPGETVLATLRGYLIPVATGPDAYREALVVIGFERASRNGVCPRAQHESP